MGSLQGNLPTADSSSLIITKATPKEILECQDINGSSWKGALTTEQYLRREDHLANQDLTMDGGITHWILVDRHQQPDNRAILGACETLRKIGLVAAKSITAGTAETATVKEITVHGIGSVFCRPEYRGRGYASRMMTELGKALETWQQPPGSPKELFSVLYSDIGKAFYAQHGWEPAQSTHIALPPINKAEYERRRVDMGLPEVAELEAKDLESICERDVKQMVRRLQDEASESSIAAIAIAPDYQHMAWHHARENFQAAELFNEYPSVKGACFNDAGLPFCIWTRSYGSTAQENVLHFIRLSYDGASHNTPAIKLETAAAALLLRAQLEASLWDMQTVEIWNPDAHTIAAAQKILPDTAVVEREKYSIASVMWNGKDHGLGEEYNWIENQKYGWC